MNLAKLKSHYVCFPRSYYFETKQATNAALNQNQKFKKLAVVVHVLQTTQSLVISRCCFAEDAEKSTKIYNARAQPLFCSLNLSFSDVPVAVADVVFLNTLSYESTTPFLVSLFFSLFIVLFPLLWLTYWSVTQVPLVQNMLSLSGHPSYRRKLTLLNESNVGPRNTLPRCHLGTLRTKKDWQCLGGPVFNQGGLIYLFQSAT